MFGLASLLLDSRGSKAGRQTCGELFVSLRRWLIGPVPVKNLVVRDLQGERGGEADEMKAFLCEKLIMGVCAFTGSRQEGDC